jgi:hypothetical protein
MMRLPVFILCLLALTMNPVKLYAQDAPQQTDEEPKTTAPIAQGTDKNNPNIEPSPEMKKLQDALGDITKPLDGLQRRHFFMIYNNNNIISTTKTVQTDVTKAIEACGKNNPDMKEALNARFKIWNDALSVQIEKAEANRDNMIIAQNYSDSKTIKNVMKIADDLRDETQMKIEKTPVTSKEACDYLLNKMDETQNTLINLLEQALVSFPQALQNDPTYLEEQEQSLQKKKSDAPDIEPESVPETKPDDEKPAAE